jgi:hypothetical protein
MRRQRRGTAEDQHLGIGMNAGQPGVGHGGEHDDLADDRRLLRRQAVDQHAHDDAQQRTGQHRRGDHQALLGVRQAKILGDAATPSGPRMTQTMKARSK